MKKNEIHKESNQNISYAQKHKNIHQQNSQGYEDKNENLTDLFKIIQLYKPKIINIEAPLKPFIPDYIPRVSFPDPMLKIPRPDGKEDYIGLKNDAK
ncbi:unnamed protein product [Paramecium primaurelia]|uniref:Uncharacterized protein n=1 Tax=Paramecium primaurelia TaxID=5886 RepID=A0A8S1NYF3_PARPR|nr:unnamed protein product [Paramecium primaurelia]